MSEDGRAILDAKMAAYQEERKQFVRGFARLVIRQGPGALAPSSTDEKPVTWQKRGRQLYGVELFNRVMREELARREEWDHAEGGTEPSGEAEARRGSERGEADEAQSPADPS